jgi:hypothetical protein
VIDHAKTDAAWAAFDRAMNRHDKRAASLALRKVYGPDKTDEELHEIVSKLVSRMPNTQPVIPVVSTPRVQMQRDAIKARAIAVDIGFPAPIRAQVIAEQDGLLWAQPINDLNQPYGESLGEFAIFPGQILSIIEP